MKRSILAMVFLGALSALAQRTTVSDTIYDSSGNLANGAITITPNQQFEAVGGAEVYPVSIAALITNGVFSVPLYPNDSTINPASGTSYSARYSISGETAPTIVETWVVPTSGGSVNLSTVRALPVPTPTYVIGSNVPFVNLNTVGVLTSNTGTQNNTAITAAVAALGSSGGELFLPPGVYKINQNLSLSKTLTFACAQGATLELDSGVNPSGFVIGIITGGSTVTITGCTFDGNKANNTVGPAFVFVFGNAHANFVGDTFQNGNFNTVLNFNGAASSLVANNTFTNNTTHDVGLINASLTLTSHRVLGNTFNFPTYGITGCTNTTPVVCTTNVANDLITGQSIMLVFTSVAALNQAWTITVTGTSTFSLNTSTASGAATGGTLLEGFFSVYANNQEGVVISNNTISGGGESIQLLGTQLSNVNNNTITVSRDAGITVGSGSAYNNIEHNNIYQTYYEGLYCWTTCSYNNFSGNTIVGAGQGNITFRRSGIYAYGPGSTGNIFSSNNSVQNGEYGIEVLSSIANTQITNNNFVGNGAGAFFHDGTETATLWVDHVSAPAYSVISTFASAFANGSQVYVSDANSGCTAGSSTGQICERVNGSWTH